MLVLSGANDVTHSLSREEIQVDDLVQDLQFVQEHLKICGMVLLLPSFLCPYIIVVV